MTFVLACMAVFSAIGCGGTPQPEPDAGPALQSGLFGPCAADTDCVTPGAFCRPSEEGFLGGSCSVGCPYPDRTPCDDGNTYNICVEQPDGAGVCEDRCLNGADCGRSGYTCGNIGAYGGEVGICIAVCSSDEQCGPNAECNRYTGKCMATGTLPTSGPRHGEACANDDACLSGWCLEEATGGVPSGFNGGYCLGNCILPEGYNTNNFYSGEALPEGTCPDGNICFPNTSFGRRDLGICLASCASDADCRVSEGYECRKSFELTSGVYGYTNGICWPIDCSVKACPTGFTCRTLSTASGTSNVCERN